MQWSWSVQREWLGSPRDLIFPGALAVAAAAIARALQSRTCVRAVKISRDASRVVHAQRWAGPGRAAAEDRPARRGARWTLRQPGSQSTEPESQAIQVLILTYKLQSIPRSRVVFQFHVTLDTVLLLTLFAVFNKKWPVTRMNCSNSVARVSWYLDIYSAYRFPICLSVLQVFLSYDIKCSKKRISVTTMTVQSFLTVDVNVSYFQLNLPNSVIRTQTCCFELARPALSVWTVSIGPIELLNCYLSRTFPMLAKIK